METTYKKTLTFGLLSVLPFLLSACFLRSLSGNVTGEEGDFTAELNATSVTANCDVSTFPGEEGLVTCFYIIEWDPSFELETTVILISKFGFFGVLVDPLILQVPDTAANFRGVFQNDPTPRDLVVTVVESFPVQPGTVVTAEPGQQFVILEFPDDVPPTLPGGDPRNGVEFDFELAFDVPALEPVDIKGMFAGKVEIEGQTFYIPLYPCVTDFAAIPSIQIPVATSPQFLIPQIVDHINNSGDVTCNDQIYDYSDLSPAGLLYLPLIVQR